MLGSPRGFSSSICSQQKKKVYWKLLAAKEKGLLEAARSKRKRLVPRGYFGLPASRI